MKELDDYYKTKKELFLYFGYKEDIETLLFDCRANFWNMGKVSNFFNTAYMETVLYGKTKAEVLERNCDRDYLYPLSSRRYNGKHYTMLVVRDGEEAILKVFDNQKEIKETIIEED